MPGAGPLDGIRILDLTRVVAGPYATGLLADLGARVVKVELPDRPDEIRLMPDQVRGMSVTFNDLNRNKQGITLDVRRERGRELFLRLVRRFDVVTENFVAGTLDRMRLGWDVLREANPKLVYAAVSGYGRDGPHAGRPSYDMVAQAVGGLMALTGPPDGPPTRTGVNLADYIGGLFLAVGILAALRERDRSGEGQLVDVSNQDALVTMLDSTPIWYKASGAEPVRGGNFHRLVAPFGAYRAKDGWVVVAIGNPRLFQSALEAIGRADLMEDPGFQERVSTFRFKDEVNALWAEFVAARTRDEVEAVCVKHRIGFGRVQSVADLASDPQLAHRDMFREVEHPDGQGPIPTRGTALRVGPAAPAVRHAAPTHGQHTDGLLQERLDLGPEEIATLRQEGVV
jgi:crotonobetainyl-CoA:carnitine CoA-transferase CaiB-like acyl-CoA transferase